MIRLSPAWAALLFLCPLARAQTAGSPSPPAATPVPDEPVFPGSLPPGVEAAREIRDGFVRYVPDAAGDIDWEIRGRGAEFKTEDIVTLIELFARSHDEELGPVSIEIPRGDYDLQARTASAPGQWVVVRRGPLLLTGKGLLWTMSREEIRILEDVRVLVKESEDLGLFPGE